MKNLIFLLLLVFILPSCIKDEDKAPDTSGLPKRIKTAIFYDHNVESQRIDYYYDFEKLIKVKLYAKVSASSDWEMVNELNYEYNLPNVTLIVNYNLMGTWTETAKIEYIIEDGIIQELNDYTNFYGNWRHDVITTYSYSNNLLNSYLKETLNADTVSYSERNDYEYVDGLIQESKQYFLLNGDWNLNKDYQYTYGVDNYEIKGYDVDSNPSSNLKVTLVGDLITKRERFLLPIYCMVGNY